MGTMRGRKRIPEKARTPSGLAEKGFGPKKNPKPDVAFSSPFSA